MKAIPARIFKKIELERFTELTNLSKVLSEIDNTEIYVLANNNQYYKIDILFNSHDGSWYLPKYEQSNDGNYTILKTTIDRDRVFITPKTINSNWVIDKTVEVAKDRVVTINDYHSARAYEKLLDLSCK